jgi:3-isopropylmalate/(R)-2-methylmalate dehydratase large subunit
MLEHSGRSTIEKIWDSHLVARDGDRDLLYVDLHLVHEVTSPQAFLGLSAAGRSVRRPDLTLATEDHNVSTRNSSVAELEPMSRIQIETLRENCARSGIPLHRLGESGQGIVHVIAPELGLVQPGSVVVCGDSHTATHGALGALAFGIGTSEVEHVLATQTLWQARPQTMRVELTGSLGPGVCAKDAILALIAHMGTGGGQGYLVEYSGSAVAEMSLEARMTLCNMSIEWGARAGLVAPDGVTAAYLRGRAHTPNAADWDSALDAWMQLRSDADAEFDAEVKLDVTTLEPQVSWGTNPSQTAPLSGRVPDPATIADPVSRANAEMALRYMALTPGQALSGLPIDAVFLGSCTNGRIEDLRSAAQILIGRQVAPGVNMVVSPGSTAVKTLAEAEGLDRVFREAGAQWRGSGCSMCPGLNDDRLLKGERVASTSNRNFEGRQGPRAKTHLVCPAVAAASAIRGCLTDPADL